MLLPLKDIDILRYVPILRGRREWFL